MAPTSRRPDGENQAATTALASAQDPATSNTHRQLRILTLNVWGLKYFSKARAHRISAISARLAASDYDIVALQEIWCEATDWRALRERCSVAFPHAKFFYSGAFGSGLAILSRFPIIATHTHPYSLNGHPVFVHHGDWIVAKAAGCATIDVAGQGLNLGLLDVWVTHTVAAGGEDGPESRRAHRITQAFELAHYARASAEKGRHVICLGDFNSTPPSLSMAILRDVGMLSDAFVEAHPDLPANATSLPSSGRLRPDPRRSIAELGVTCDSPLNTWTAGKPLDERALKGAGKRLDYILFRGPTSSSHRSAHHGQRDKGQLRCRESTVVFTELLEDSQMSFSDHYGLEAAFDVISSEDSREGKASSVDRSAHSSRIAQTLSSSLSALAAALISARRQQRRHFLAFFAALLFALLAIISVATSNPGGGFKGAFWSLLAVVCGWAGTTALYSALIWGEWEQRALRTFLEAMDLDLADHRRPEESSNRASSATASAPANTDPQPEIQNLVQVD